MCQRKPENFLTALASKGQWSTVNGTRGSLTSVSEALAKLAQIGIRVGPGISNEDLLFGTLADWAQVYAKA